MEPTFEVIQSAEKRVGPLTRQTALPRAEILEHMIQTFSERNTTNGLLEDDLTDEEIYEAEELVQTRYGDPAWIHRLP